MGLRRCRRRWPRTTVRPSRRPRSASSRSTGRTRQSCGCITCNTQGNKPAIAKACATKLLSQGADIIMTTCDVDFAAPVIQTAINRGKLTVAAVHRHRPDGTEALRREGSAGVLVRKRRAGRGIGDGRVRLEAWLEDGVACDGHRDRLLPQRRAGVQGALSRSSAGRSRPRRRTSRSAGTRRRGRASSRGSTARMPTSSSRRRLLRSARRCRSSPVCGRWGTTRRS